MDRTADHRWEPGTLGMGELEQIIVDAMGDLWTDHYRRGDASDGERRRRFRRSIETAIYCAIGEEWRIER